MVSNNWIIDDRGYEKNLVYFPGWATDISFLQQDKLPFNLIYPETLITPAHLPVLANLLTMPTFILGWSMGGFLALQFANQYPNKVSELIIASIRQEYPRDIIASMKENLLADKNNTQKKFYQQAFYPSMLAEYRKFKEHENVLIISMDREYLLTGLEYLENNSSGDAPVVPTTYLHGEKDIIAPAAEGTAWAVKQGVEYIILPDAPHVLPYCDQFYEIINEKFK